MEPARPKRIQYFKKIAEGCDEHTKIIPYSIILVWSEYEFELGEETKSVP